MRPSLANLLLGLASTACFIAVVEGAARLLERRRPAPVVADYIWDWEKKWDGDFYTIRSDANGWPPWEEFNADGVRDRTHAVEKPEAVRRVVFLGDSVTLGDGIQPAEAYPQLLQARFDAEGRGVEVFSIALWGWSTRQERIAYERIARRYRPDQVVVAVCLNDIPELQNNLARPPKLLAGLHQRSALVRRIVNAPGREIQNVEELFRKKDSPKVREAFERFFAEVRSLRDEARRDGAAFSVLVLPFRFQVEAGAPPPVVQAEIVAFCAREGIPAFDLLPAIRKLGGDAFLDYDHLSPRGAALVAEQVLASGIVAAGPSAREVLGDRGGSTAALIALLKDEGEAVRREAARALGGAGSAATPPAAAALFDALPDPRQSVRWEAARALARLGAPVSGSLAPLVKALKNPDPYVRGFAAWSLGERGAAAKEAVPALVEALQEEEGYGRGGAAAALAKMGAAAADAVPALIEGLKSPDGDRRWKAARTLGRVGPAAAAAVPALVEALGDPNEHVRSHAARALGRVGAGASAAVPALERAAGDSDPAVRKEAAEALGRVRGG